MAPRGSSPSAVPEGSPSPRTRRRASSSGCRARPFAAEPSTGRWPRRPWRNCCGGWSNGPRSGRGAVVPDAFRVLLVDDSEVVTEMLSWLLGSAGYEIETAVDGMKGVRAALRRVPDLVMMSTRLPRLDGIQACRLLKAERATRDVPVILLTSEEAGADRLHAARAGADRCLLRDVSPEEALPAVRECLAGKTPRSKVESIRGSSPGRHRNPFPGQRRSRGDPVRGELVERDRARGLRSGRLRGDGQEVVPSPQ